MITYEIICEYLSPPINLFSSQPNITLNSSTFKHFGDIFDSTFYRYGVTTMHNSKNVSLQNSIQYCIDIDISIDTNANLWDISNNIHVNIIIFDFKNNKIFATYFDNYFNPWRPTILLANYNDMWEPIVSKETKIFSFSSNKSSILKNKILTSEITEYNKTDKLNINDNFLEILEIEQFINKNETFVNNTTFSRNKLDKMKKDELLQIISNMNVTIKQSRPTKKDLIKIICKE